MDEVYQTDKQIKDETDELLKECIDWAFHNFTSNMTTEDLRSIGICRFLYLKDKLLNHSPRYYRDKELKQKGVTKEAIIKNG